MKLEISKANFRSGDRVLAWIIAAITTNKMETRSTVLRVIASRVFSESL